MFRVNNGTATAGGWTDTGNTQIGIADITGLNPGLIAGVNIGDYVTVSAGFPSSVHRYAVTGKGATYITLNTVATSNQSGVTVQSVANMYTDGVAGQIARTVLNSIHFNAMQEEIVNTILELGGSLSAGDPGQMGALVKAKLLEKLNVAGQLATGELGVTSGGKYIKFDTAGRIVSLPASAPVQTQAARQVILQYSAASVAENGEAIIYEGSGMDWVNGGILIQASCRKGVFSPDHSISFAYKGSGADVYALMVDNAASGMNACGGIYSSKTPGAGVYIKLENATKKILICNSSGVGTIALVGLINITYS